MSGPLVQVCWPAGAVAALVTSSPASTNRSNAGREGDGDGAGVVAVADSAETRVGGSGTEVARCVRGGRDRVLDGEDALLSVQDLRIGELDESVVVVGGRDRGLLDGPAVGGGADCRSLRFDRDLGRGVVVVGDSAGRDDARLGVVLGERDRHIDGGLGRVHHVRGGAGLRQAAGGEGRGGSRE